MTVINPVTCKRGKNVLRPSSYNYSACWMVVLYLYSGAMTCLNGEIEALPRQQTVLALEAGPACRCLYTTRASSLELERQPRKL